MVTVEFWFDFSCPYAYLASQAIEGVCARAGAHLAWSPMLLGGVFRAIGAGDGPLPGLQAAKALNNARDMQRWAERRGLRLQIPPAHPMRTVRALRTLLGLPAPAWPAAMHALYAAYWQQGADLTDDAVIAAALTAAGIDGAQLAAAQRGADSDAAKDELRRRTDAAVARGVFGAPAMVVVRDDQPPVLLWGQDRLHWLEAVLAGWDPDRGAPPIRPTSDPGAGSTPQIVADPSTPSSPTQMPSSPAQMPSSPAQMPSSPAQMPSSPAQMPSSSAQMPSSSAQMQSSSPSGEAPVVDFWFDYASPFAYLGATQIEAVAAAAGATVRFRPMLLGALFKEVGTPGVPLFELSPPKRRYIATELERFARWWGVDYRFASRFPMRSVMALRLTLLAGDQAPALVHRLFRALWAEDRDLASADELRAQAAAVGLDPALVDRTSEPAIKQALIDSTAAAQAAGVFGAPTMVVHAGGAPLLFWGQDRLDLVAAALRGWRPEAG